MKTKGQKTRGKISKLLHRGRSKAHVIGLGYSSRTVYEEAKRLGL